MNTNPSAPLGAGSVVLGSSYTDSLASIPLKLLPITPVAFNGTDAMVAWGRLLLYGLVATGTWQKHRSISYVAMGAAGLSLATSLSAMALAKPYQR